jgi:predicted enzyme related to lactoylglutathione lyase
VADPTLLAWLNLHTEGGPAEWFYRDVLDASVAPGPALFDAFAHPGADSGWVPLVAVDEETTERILATAEPHPAVNLSYGVVLADPGGGLLAAVPAGIDPDALASDVGTILRGAPIAGATLVSTDVGTSSDFYAATLGWNLQDAATADADVAHDELRDDAFWVMSTEVDQLSRPGWRPDFHVDDVDLAAARTVELGGQVLLPPMDFPIGRFAMVADPAGVTFGITTAMALCEHGKMPGACPLCPA